MFTIYNSKTKGEFIVFHNQGNTLITVKDNNIITIISTDSLAKDDRNILSYNKANFNLPLHLNPLQNVLYFKGKKVLILDKDAIYSLRENPDVLVLTQSPEVNLTRILHELKPLEVVADGTNYKNSIRRWKETCLKEKIPFHATAEKGYYSIK
jgi:competence protein ComEC